MENTFRVDGNQKKVESEEVLMISLLKNVISLEDTATLCSFFENHVFMKTNETLL